MLICGDCSARNNDGERFCSNCGAYLVWQRTSAEAEEERRLPTVSGTSRGPDVTTAQLPVVPGPSATLGAGSSVTASRDVRNSIPPGGPASAAHMAGSSTNPGAGLEERKPEKQGGRVPHEGAPQPPHNDVAQIPGGLTCRRCGAGNKRDVNFCRQCGASLKEAAPAPPVPPWWRQILSRTKPPALPAGTRPGWRKQRRFPKGAVSFLTVLGLFAGVAFLGRVVIAGAVTRVVDEIREDQIPVQTKKASSDEPPRGAELAFDGTERSWASKGPATAGDDFLEAGFSTPWRLTYVVITSAVPNGDHDPATEQKPVKVEIIVSRANGAPASLTVELNESKTGPQSFYFGADQASSVKLRILKSAGPDGARVSVAELQVFGRQ